MEILSAILTENDISLVTDQPFTRLVLTHGTKLNTSLEITGLNTSTYTITKEALGLDTLDNGYFRVETFDNINNKAGVGLYNLEVVNNIEKKLYDASNLKKDLDNLNFYEGLLFKLNNEYKDFQAANDVFFTLKNFLENKINGNNFLKALGKQV